MRDIGAWLRAGWVGSKSDSEESGVLRAEDPEIEAPFVAKLPNTFRNRKVVHESGHALVAWLCTHTYVTELDVEAAAGNGKLAYSVIVDSMRASEIAWARVVIGLGGIAGELKMLGNFRSGHSARDLALAREDVKDVKEIPEVAGAHATLFDREIFKEPLDDSEKKIFNAALTLAKRLLVVHEDRYLKLVERCMTQDRLNEEEINQALGSREPVLFLRRLGFSTFWLKDHHG